MFPRTHRNGTQPALRPATDHDRAVAAAALREAALEPGVSRTMSTYLLRRASALGSGRVPWFPELRGPVE